MKNHSIFLKNNLFNTGERLFEEFRIIICEIVLIHSYKIYLFLGLCGVFLLFLFHNSILKAQSISAGGEHSIARCNNGKLRAWGLNNDGQVGNGSNSSESLPVQVSNISGVRYISAGSEHSLALKDDGTIWSWGNNYYGELGIGTTTDKNTPQKIPIDGIISIASGWHHSLAVKNDGTVWTWGDNSAGICGDTLSLVYPAPVQIIQLNGIVSVAGGGGTFSLALKNNGTVWAWGLNPNGQLGNGTTTDSWTPVQVSSLSGIIKISAGPGHSLALRSDGTVWAWGSNSSGQLGDGTNTHKYVPVQVSGLSGIVSISAGGNFSIAIKSDGTVWAWGWNGYGQLGNGTSYSKDVPVQVLNINGITEIDAGQNHVLAMKNDSTVWAWGSNNDGRLGVSSWTLSYSDVPILVTGLCPVTSYVEQRNIDKRDLVLFPNPTDNESHLLYQLIANEKGEVEIMNMLGECIAKYNLVPGQKELFVNTANMENGIYFYRVRVNEKVIVTNRLVVIH